jgi:hypothetical protein
MSTSPQCTDTVFIKTIETGMILLIIDIKKILLCIFFKDLGFMT